jgi:Raf kinase inhibitor-like YbhB/YbcL family protein
MPGINALHCSLKSLIIVQIVLFLLAGSEDAKEVNFVIRVTSPGFENQGEIHKKYTCDGEDIAPALAWSNVPEKTKSFALIVDDPDAPDPANPRMTWVHWVLYDLPPETVDFPEGVVASVLHALDGLNDWNRTGYGGPCPPIGRHRYFFKLFALDTRLGDLHRPTSAQLLRAFTGHLLAEARVVGLYAKGRP